MESLLTGSRVYGTPTDESDIDVVCLMSHDEFHALLAMADNPDCETRPASGKASQSLRFGKLNLICVTPNEYDKFTAWKDGTAHLKSIAPVTREAAVEHFKSRGV